MNTINNSNTAEAHHEQLEKSHKSSHKLGITIIVLIFGLFGLWSIFADLDTTITAQGKVITQSYNKTVMHPYGGIVRKIFVQEGAQVKKNQPLIELDNTDFQSKLFSNISKHDKNLFSLCRLAAEATLQISLQCTKYQKDIINVTHLDKLSNDAKNLFESDIRNLNAKVDLLKSQNEILISGNEGLTQQIGSYKKLLNSYQKELYKWNKLLKADVVDELKAIQIQRQIEQTHLQIFSLESKIKENKATIHAHTKQIELEKESFKNKALIQQNELELENNLIGNVIFALKNSIANSTLKSPSDGLITDMKVHATGEVIIPQKSIMSIVPNEKDLIIEAYIFPTDIEKVYKGQKVEVSFPSFIDPAARPIDGELTYISADTLIPENAQENFYKVLVKITPNGFETIQKNHFNIIPGMPSAVFIKTGKTTLLEYLTRPMKQMYKGIYNDN